MTIKGRRIFNYRPICFCALSIVVGVLIAEALYGENPILFIIPSLLFLTVFVFLVCIKKCRRFVYIPIAFIVGIMSMSLSAYTYDCSLISGYNGVYQARVVSEITLYDSDDGGKIARFEVDQIVVDGKEYKHKADVKVDASFVVDVSGNFLFDAGDIVSIDGTLSPYKHKKFNILFASTMSKDYAYSAKANSVSLLKHCKAPFPLNIKQAMWKTFNEWLDDDTATITKALIYGDVRGMDKGIYESISASGLIHVLSVSGLHISTLSTAVYFLLKKLKINKKVSYFIAVGMTFIYVMICNFVAPAVRSFLMSAVFNFASAFGKKRDEISALSLSLVLILMFRPFALMELGLLLSYFCMLGIFMFNSTFEDKGMQFVSYVSPKRKIGKKFVQVLATSLATNIVVYPLVAYYFQSVPTLFVLSNFIMLPYTMFLYILDLVMTVLSLITTWGGFTWILKYFTMPFTLYSQAVASLPIATIPVWVSMVWVVILPIIMVFVSKYIFLPRKVKVAGTLSMTAIGVACSTLFLLV